jgi:hypothetical protein
MATKKTLAKKKLKDIDLDAEISKLRTVAGSLKKGNKQTLAGHLEKAADLIKLLKEALYG